VVLSSVGRSSLPNGAALELLEAGSDEPARLISLDKVNKLLVRSVIVQILHWDLALCDLSYSFTVCRQDSLSCTEAARNLVGAWKSEYQKYPPS
jgi:hypothetical protein